MDQETISKLRSVMIEILDEFIRICDENKLSYFLHAGTLLGAVRHKGFIPWDDDIDVAMPREDYEKFLDIYYKLENTDYYVLSDRSPENTSYYYTPFAKLCKKGTVFADSIREPDEYSGIYIDIFPFDKCLLFLAPLQTKLINYVLLFSKFKSQMYMPQKKYKIIIGRILFFFISKHFIITFYRKLFLLFNNYKTRYISFFSGFYGYKRESHKYRTVFPLSKIEFEGKYYCAPCNYDLFLKEMYGNYMELPPVEQRVTHNPEYIIFNEVEQENGLNNESTL